MSPERVADAVFAAAMIGAWLAENAVAIVSVILAGGGVWAAVRIAQRRALRETPAAPDNHAGTDVDLLWQCRRIHAEPLADPDTTRRLINELRDNAGEGEL